MGTGTGTKHRRLDHGEIRVVGGKKCNLVTEAAIKESESETHANMVTLHYP